MMALWYCVLAVFLAITLNHRSRFIRSLATVIAALSLVLMVSSIFLADFDGTFAHQLTTPHAADGLKPLILNLQGIVGTAGIVFLLWASGRQYRRREVSPLPLANAGGVFGFVSRYAHWMVAILILALIPMGLFMSILPADSPDRGSFVDAHQTMGLVVLILVIGRLAWLSRSPPPAFAGGLRPWEPRLAHAAHIALYGLILTFPLTGLFMTMARGETVRFFGAQLPALFGASAEWSGILAILHDYVLQVLFYVVLFLHLGAVLKHHFLDRRLMDVRRMLR